MVASVRPGTTVRLAALLASVAVATAFQPTLSRGQVHRHHVSHGGSLPRPAAPVSDSTQDAIITVAMAAVAELPLASSLDALCSNIGIDGDDRFAFSHATTESLEMADQQMLNLALNLGTP